MKTLLTLCLLMMGLHPLAQKYLDYNMKEVKDPGAASYVSATTLKDNVWTKENYFISNRTLQMRGSYMDEAAELKHGSFEYYYANGRLESKGKYVMNEKDGIWLSYHANGMLRDSVNYIKGTITGTRLSYHSNGYVSDSLNVREDGLTVWVGWFNNGFPSKVEIYRNGMKTGKFQYFHKNGQLATEQVYQMDKLVLSRYFNEKGEEISEPEPDRAASFPGGSEAWKKYMGKRAFFPEQWRLKNTSSVTITVRALIDEEGNVGDIYVQLPFHEDFDRVALDIMKRSPKWQPAIKNNRKVSYWVAQSITFRQEE